MRASAAINLTSNYQHTLSSARGDFIPLWERSLRFNRRFQMIKPATLLVQLQGKAVISDQCRIKRIDGIETAVWELDDRSTIIIQGESNTYRGKPAAKIFDIKKSSEPYKKIVSRLKRQATNLAKSKQVSLCN